MRNEESGSYSPFGPEEVIGKSEIEETESPEVVRTGRNGTKVGVVSSDGPSCRRPKRRLRGSLGEKDEVGVREESIIEV